MIENSIGPNLKGKFTHRVNNVQKRIFWEIERCPAAKANKVNFNFSTPKFDYYITEFEALSVIVPDFKAYR